MAGRPKRRTDLARLADLGMDRITAMLAEGRTARSVAAELNVSEGTLRVCANARYFSLTPRKLPSCFLPFYAAWI